MQAEKIDHIRFTAISPEMIKKMSVAKIVVADTCNDEGYPIDGALLDQRLGVIDPGLKCKTCGGKIKTCPGHFGHIELVRPVVHPEFAKTMYLLLDATCDTCHRILLTEKQVDTIKQDIVDFVTSGDETLPGSPSMQHDKNPSMIKKLKGVKKCPHCLAEQRKIKFERPTSFYIEGSKLKPDDIRDWLSKISNEDLAYVGIDGSVTRPEWFIITDLLVAPVNIRPSITLESGERSEDDLTHKLLDVIRTNQRLEQDIDAGAPQIIIDDLWELLQYQVTIYFNNETPGVPVARQRNTRPLKTLAQRLKGKEGRLRYNLSGKRVNFSARTVITPDNNISLNEVGVPQKFAENLTVPFYVTKWNIDEAKKFLSNKEYPTAINYTSKANVRKRVADVNREELLNSLQPGDALERQLTDGDIVLFNRQPTLHRASVIALSVRVLPGKTFRLHLNVTIPFNADFDGDEMNMHVPQSLEAQAEARYLMTAEDLILSARDGLPVMFAEEDIISGAYMLTKDGASFTKDEASRMLASVDVTELPKPMRNGMYDGKAIFSMILPKGLDIESKHARNKVIIKDGELKEGHLGIGMIDGDGLLILEIYRTYGKEETRKFLDNVTKLAVRAVYTAGVTISLKDYYASEALLKERDKALREADERAKELLTKYNEKKLLPLPGYTRKQTYEIETFATLDITRGIISKMLSTHLSPENNAMLMVAIKSRGSMLNLVQTSMFLGQQAVRGGRPSRGYSNRVLPYFEKNDKTPEAKGFVKSNFLNGLNLIDYYMHAMGARDSGIGKPLITADSGYLQRRLINALQDFYVESDGSVRDASGSIIQTIYGGDAIDPMKEVLARKRKSD